MNHQPFENWLLSEEPLSGVQMRELREHLNSCEKCSRMQGAWVGVRQLFRETPRVEPGAGFVNRWQARLAEQRQQAQRRQSYRMLGVMGTISFALFVALSVYGFSLLQSPGQLLMIWIYRLAALFTYADATRDLIASFLNVFTSVVPGTVWLFSLGAVCMISVLWLVVFQQLTAPRRIEV